jgi:16S rRNA (cytidine1402-2'-O)-methyltransferase
VDRRTPELVDRIVAGEVIALVSDAGTPGVSDPGAHLVDACIDADLPVDVLPGASAITTALVASGLPTYAFYFGGFLPRKQGDRRRRLETLLDLDATLLFYESPRRAAATMASIAEVMPSRQAVMARELTKMHQEVARACVADLAQQLEGRELKGEVVLVIGPPTESEHDEITDGELERMLQERMTSGDSRKDAVRDVVAETGVPRNRVYELALAVSE